ncbi:hypothetical protein TNCT_373991 [Trichonephila clavata]|uniref:Uncharacterized protein n=1 Tax=Trichonephila clavata TaxID=2740835 RepID=A0A8X6J6M1_TRICU|nr:hypothetical protein TNCT_373991 [Trichonephila clavata]
MDHKTLEKAILLVWLYFTIRILFVTYWDALFLPPVLIVLDSLFKDSKSDTQTLTDKDHFQRRRKNLESNKEQDQNLTKEDGLQKISKSTNTETDPYLNKNIAKIQEPSFAKLMDLKNSLKTESKNSQVPPNSSTLTINPSKKLIPTKEEISTSSKEDNMKDSKKNIKDSNLDQNYQNSRARFLLNEIIMDMKNSLRSENKISEAQLNPSTSKEDNMKDRKKNIKDTNLDQNDQNSRACFLLNQIITDMKNSLSSENKISEAQLNPSTSQPHEQRLQKR